MKLEKYLEDAKTERKISFMGGAEDVKIEVDHSEVVSGFQFVRGWIIPERRT